MTPREEGDAGEGRSTTRPAGGFPVAAGIWLGLGLGGFFDGIVLHQILQWHHLVSQPHPPVDLESLKLNTLWDGLFHAATYVFVAIGLVILWRSAHRTQIRWSSRALVGALLMGFGLFNTVEGLINHQILGLHHVNETAPPDHWLAWDLGFIAWGLLMLLAGRYLCRNAGAVPNLAKE